MRIGIDIDGVLNYIEQFQLEYAIPWFVERGYSVKKPDGFDIMDIFECSEELRNEFWKSNRSKKGIYNALIFDFARNSEARPGIVEMLNKIEENGDHFFIISERYGTDKNGVFSKYCKHLVYKWLKKNNVNIPKKDVLFVPFGKSKKDVYIENDIDIILEDNVKNIKAIEDIEDLYAIVFNAGHNKDYDNEKLYRVDLPTEVFPVIKQIESRKRKKEKENQIVRPNQFLPKTGKASVDMVWRQYIPEEDEEIEIPNVKMIDFLRERSKAFSDVVMIDDNYGNKITYKEFFNKYVPMYAKAFTANGVKEGDCVIIALPNILATQAAKFALNEIGAIPVMANPLSSPDEFTNYFNIKSPSGNKPKVMLMFNRSFKSVKEAMNNGDNDIEIIICMGVNNDFNTLYNMGYKLLESKNDPTKEELRKVKEIISCMQFLEGGKKIDNYPVSKFEKNTCAVIYFTGGTTGNEKSVMITNENAIAIALQFTKYIKGDKVGKVTINAMPWFHVYGDNQIFYFASCNGMINVPVAKFDRNKVESLFKKNYPIVNYNGVPTFFRATFANLKDISRLSHIENMISGGDSIPIEEVRKNNKVLKRAGSQAVMRTGYGITEGAGGVCYTLVGEDEEDCIGIPTPGTNMKIVAPGTEEELSYNETGEICFSGPSVMAGYLNNPIETANVLRLHKDGRIWFHSGDMGFAKDNGKFYFATRIKRMIIVSGENVYPNRIENVILENFVEIVDQCYVIGRKDIDKGEIPVAKILLKSGVKPSKKIQVEIRELCKAKFKNKKYWPVSIDFIKYVPQTKMSKADLKKMDAPSLIIDLDEERKVLSKEEKVKENYASNRFYMNFSGVYSKIYKAKWISRDVTYIGRENIPEHGAGIIAMNHLNAQDQNAVLSNVDRIISLPSKKEYFDRKLSSFFMTRMEMIPVDRNGDVEFAKEWAKGLVRTSPLADYIIDSKYIKDILNYIDSINAKNVKSPKELVQVVKEYILSRNSSLSESLIDRLTNMPVSGGENGYGRAQKINEVVLERLNAGRLIGVFPEGTRNNGFIQSGILLPFHDGVVYWARDTYSPIIPTAITGDHKRGGEILVRSGNPIYIDSDLSKDDIKEATANLRDEIYKLVLLNLINQETEYNNIALEKAIDYLLNDNSVKSKDILEIVFKELESVRTERNERMLIKLS